MWPGKYSKGISSSAFTLWEGHVAAGDAQLELSFRVMRLHNSYYLTHTGSDE
jgi:hypothetical protein